VCLEAVVEHGADQNLVAEFGKGAVAGDQCRPRRDAAAATDSGDQEPLGVDTEFGRVLRHPHQSRVTVLDGRGIGVIRRQRVLDRHETALPSITWGRRWVTWSRRPLMIIPPPWRLRMPPLGPRSSTGLRISRPMFGAPSGPGT
jgi:hypothetical protein